MDKPTLSERLFYMYYDAKWSLQYKFRRTKVFLTMLLKREKRVYYLYGTCEVIEINAFNYSRVKLEGDEWAMIEYVNRSGEKSWCKAERF